MPVRLADEKINLIEETYNKHSRWSIAEIARRTGTSYTTVYRYVGIRKRGFESISAYRSYLARQNGFESDTEYKEASAKEKGFKSLGEYYEHLAKQQGFSSLYKYRQHLANKKGFSLSGYNKQTANQRRKRPANLRMRKITRDRLEEIDKTLGNLADETGMTTAGISQIVSGRNLPKKSNQSKIFRALGLPYETVDEMMADKSLKY